MMTTAANTRFSAPARVTLRRLAVACGLAAAAWAPATADDWPQWRGPSRDGVWRESGIVERLPAELTFRWRTPIGSGFAGPAVADGKVFVFDRLLPAEAGEPENRWNLNDPVHGDERILCLDAATGRVLWSRQYACRYRISYPTGPRATPAIDGDRLYCVGAMGDLHCLAVADGSVIWRKSYVDDYGTEMNPWGMASAPLIDGDRCIVLAGGAAGACVVAFDKRTGAEIWRALDAKDPGYSSPILIEHAGLRQLIVWNSLGVYGLSPETGKVFWEQAFPTKMAHSVASPVFDAASGRLFVTSFFDGPLMLQLTPGQTGARPLWKGTSQSERPDRTDKLHGLMSTPILDGDHLYGVCSYGHLRCLDAATGNRLWATLEATGEARWSNAFLVRHQDRVFLLNEHGDLILATLAPGGYRETGRVKLLEPTTKSSNRLVLWSHPAFANRCVFARNDREIVCASLASN